MSLSRAMATAALALSLVGCQKQGRDPKAERVCQCECLCPGTRASAQAGPAAAPTVPVAAPARPAAVAAPPARPSVPGVRFHIGVMTGAAALGEEGARGAEQLLRDYGAVENGGMIQHLTYPDADSSRQEAVVSSLVFLGGDPLMKVIVVDRAIPGVSEAFKRIKTKRPDILLLAGSPQEELPIIQAAADLIVDSNFVARGYSIAWAAKQMGARTLVHISFPRHLSIESMSRRRAIMEAASKDLGLAFAMETAPDPSADTGTAGARRFIRENVPQWLQKYGTDGKKVAFFCTSDVHARPLLEQLLASPNGVFVEADLPSPLVGYPEALGLDLSREGQLPIAKAYPDFLKKIEEAVVAKGGAGRFGTWAFGCGASVTAGLAEFGKSVVEGKAERTSMKDLLATLGKFTPGTRWSGDYYVDAKSGTRARNQVLVYADTHVFGKGNLPTTQQKVPAKYRSVKR